MEDAEVTQTTTDLTLIPSAPEAVLQCCPYGLTTCFQLPLRKTTSHSERRCSVAVLRGSSGDGTSVRRCGYGPLLTVTGLHKATNHKAIRLSEHGGENCKVGRTVTPVPFCSLRSSAFTRTSLEGSSKQSSCLQQADYMSEYCIPGNTTLRLQQVRASPSDTFTVGGFWRLQPKPRSHRHPEPEVTEPEP